MRSVCAVGWGLSVVLALGLGAMGYVFLIRGNVEPYADGRTAVLLLPDERNRVLGEMRGLLEAVQEITVAAAQGDMATVAKSASAEGMAAAEAESPQMIAKLPLEFKRLGMSTHKAFDDLAAFAGTTDDRLEVTARLGGILDNCTSCHAGYRLGLEDADKEK